LEKVYIDLKPESCRTILKIMANKDGWQKALNEALQDADFRITEQEILKDLEKGQVNGFALEVLLTAASIDLKNTKLMEKEREKYLALIKELRKYLKMLPHLGVKKTYIYSASFSVKNELPSAHLIFHTERKLSIREVLERLFCTVFELKEEDWVSQKQAVGYPTLKSYIESFSNKDLAKCLVEEGMTSCAVTSVYEYQNRLQPETHYLDFAYFLKGNAGKTKHYYNKLIRDKAPQTLEALGKQYTIRYADDKLYKEKLKEKLREEVFEYLRYNNPKELADVLEVIYALLKEEKMSFKELDELRKQKYEKRGGFDKRIILIDAER
jgi:predicted house-cleaning noncanonical NTP pyrophosphatase (MazG superfamily)